MTLCIFALFLVFAAPSTAWAAQFTLDNGLALTLVALAAGVVGFALARMLSVKDREGMIKSCGALEHRANEAESRLSEAARDLADARKKLEDVLANSTQGFFRISRQGEILDANESAARMLGYANPEQMTNKSGLLNQALAPGARRRDDLVQAFTRGRCVRDFEIELSRVDGTRGWFNFNARPVLNESGDIKYVEGFFEEITLRKQAEESLIQSEEKFARFLDNMNIGFYRTTADPGGRFIQANAALSFILGFDNPADIYRHAPGEFHVDHRSRSDLIEKLREQGMLEDHESELKRVDGTPVWVVETVTLYQDKDDGSEWLEGLMVDVSAQKLARQLERDKMEINTASRVKSRYLTDVSHKIRTDLNTVMGMIDLLLNTPLGPEQVKYVRVCKQANDSLLAMIEESIDSASLEVAEADGPKTLFSPGQMVEGVCVDMARRVAGNDVEIICSVDPDTPEALVGNSMGLRQILINLTANAIRFTERGEVVVHVAPAENSGSRTNLAFTVRDTGRGIDAERLPTIFNGPDEDGELTRNSGETGLGLLLCKNYIDKMGGDMFVESEPGLGSVFRFTVRLEEADPVPPSLYSPGELSGLSVLVVDDNRSGREMLRQFLVWLGAEVRMAKSGQVALEAVRQGFDLVLMDTSMPGLSGPEAARLMSRAGDEVDHVLLMARPEEADQAREAVDELGLFGVISKPVCHQELVDQAHRLMDVRRARSQGEDAPVPKPPRPLSILAVEDTPDNQILLEYYLKGTEHGIEFADNGRLAVNMFKTGNYDLVIMDIQMPVMDGHECTRIMRRMEEEQGRDPVPIIALTAHANEENKKQCQEAGCDDFIVKPVAKKALVAVVDRFARG